MLNLKHNVNVFGIKPEMNLAITVVNSIYTHHDYDCIVTSITDGKHSHASEHYKGYGVDFRTFHIAGGSTGAKAVEIFDDIQEALTDEYVVLLESDHIHVSFNPTLASKETNA